MVSACHCFLCQEPVFKDHLCKEHLEEQQEDYGELPAQEPGAEVVWLVQVEQSSSDDGNTYIVDFETSSAHTDDIDVVRVEIYMGVRARVILFNRKADKPVVYNYPWAKVLHWQEV